MIEDLSNAILAYNLASSSLGTALDRLTWIMKSGVDVHSSTYAGCIERIETLQQILVELDKDLEQLRKARNEQVKEGPWV